MHVHTRGRRHEALGCICGESSLFFLVELFCMYCVSELILVLSINSINL